MNQYNSKSKSNYGKAGNPYRREPKKGGFLTVLLFYVLPFLIVNGIIFFLATSRPKGEITIEESTDYISTAMNLKITSLLPLKSMEVTLDGSPIQVTKTGSRNYTAVLTSNGNLEARLTCFNLMKNVLYEPVSVLDDTPPTVKDKNVEDGILSFRLEDSQSGVDFSSISAADETSARILPLSIDRAAGLVTFEMDKDNMAVIARDKIGNELHITFTPNGESIEDEEDEEAAEEDVGELEGGETESGN